MKMFFQFILLIPFIILSACSEKSDVIAPPNDVIPQNPSYTDTELLNKVQQDAFKYFWNFLF